MLVSKDSKAEYIKGFEFERGFKYKLKVKVTELSPELSDDIKYDFDLTKQFQKRHITLS